MAKVLVGTVKALWRYPVKSMQGERLDAAVLTPQGLLGDRVYALWDEQSHQVASAKNPKKWAKLLTFQARLKGDPGDQTPLPEVEITWPDGRSLRNHSPKVNHTLSTTLGRPVTLIATAPTTASIEHYWPDVEGTAHQETITQIVLPSGTFFDACHVHALTTATLARLQALSPASNFDARRFRPNIVIQPTQDDGGFIEETWINRTLTIGEGAQLDVFTGCPRCVMTTLPQSDLPADLEILRTTAQHNRVIAGIRASVRQRGVIRCNDPVWLDPC